MLQTKYQNAPETKHDMHRVRPCVDADLMFGHVLFAENIGAFKATRSDDEKGSQEILRR